MQLQFSFTILLSGLLVVLSSTYFTADALPVPTGQSVRRATLPLKRIPQRRDIHPQILLQQQINRAHRRLARMTGREQPCDEELARNLEKRVLAVEGPEGLQKRYNRQSLRPAKQSTKKGQQLAANLNATLGHNFVRSEGVTKADPPGAPNSLGLDIEGAQLGYLATVQMGTPPQDFLLLIDTGSADLWVGAENCHSDDGGDCGPHKFLGSQSSQTFKDTGKPFSITYGSGSVSGTIITDSITIAGHNLNPHTFGVATTESDDFSSDDIVLDGIMGLAKSVASQQKTLTPIESLAGDALVEHTIVGYKLARIGDSDNDGEITFGDVDQTKFDPTQSVWLPNVSEQGFWEAAVDGVSVNGQDLGLNGRTAIFDTGSTVITMPEADATQIHNQIPGAQADGLGGFTIPCDTNAQVAFTFGGQTFTIDSSDLAFGFASDETSCVSGISSGDVGGANEWLLGDTFLRNAYFATDTERNRMMLGKLV